MMHLTRGRVLIAFAPALLLASSAAAQNGGTLTNGAATYVQTTAPNSTASFASPTGAVFQTESTAPNQLFQNWWYYRVQGDSTQYPFGTYTRSTGGQIAGSSNYTGNVATYNWTDTNSSSVTRFTAIYTSTLTHGAQAGNATLSQSFQITNPSVNALTITLFNYADIDANGPSANDTDTATGGVSAITDTDGPWQVVHSAVGAAAYQVTAFSTLRNSLLGTSVYNLNDTGLPFGPGDYTGAFQWNLTVPGNSSTMVTSALAISPVPEPGTLLLTGAVAAGAFAWRRRRRG